METTAGVVWEENTAGWLEAAGAEQGQYTMQTIYFIFCILRFEIRAFVKIHNQTRPIRDTSARQKARQPRGIRTGMMD